MRIGIIGNWGHHVCVLEETDLMPEARVVGLVPGIVAEDLSSLQAKYREAETFPDHHQMLAKARPDVVLISTRLDRIARLAIETAQAGFNSICEKPLALNHQDLQALWQAVVANKTQCLAMLQNRSQPVLAAAKKWVDSGRIGAVKLLNARKSYKCQDAPTGWLGRRETYGGTIPWVGIHALDFISIVAGCGFSSVSALHANVDHPLQPEREDICALTLGLTNGAIATASLDYLRPLSASTHGDDWIRVVGTKGSLEVAMERGVLTIIDNGGVEQITDFPPREAYYPGLLRRLSKPGTSAPIPEVRQSFALTHAALCARDAADQLAVVTDLRGPWNE